MGKPMSVNVLGEQEKALRATSTACELHSRSLLKALSWRITGTLDTFVISFVVTGNVSIAGSIAGVELLTKITLYYGHERIWAAIAWGRH